MPRKPKTTDQPAEKSEPVKRIREDEPPNPNKRIRATP